MRPRRDLLLVLGFCAGLLAPALSWRLDPGSWIALRHENRFPAPFPELPRDAPALRGFMPAVEAWQADTLGLRTPLLCLNNLLALRVWHKLPSETLLLGRDDWIFYTGEDSRTIWRGLYRVPREYASNWTSSLRSRAAWFARRGIAYLYVVAPNKESLYPERLPEGEEALGPTLLERLADELGSQPDLPLCDLRGPLFEERARDRPAAGDFLFHPLGTHWTERGAWRAAQAIGERLEQLYPELGPWHGAPREECQQAQLAGELGDTWATSLRLERFCRQRVYSFRPRASEVEACSADAWDLEKLEGLFERRDGAGERVLLVHDSFGPGLREPLAESCSELATLWSEELPLERILAFGPRVVLELRSERRLRKAPAWLEDPPEPLSPERFRALPGLAPRTAGKDSIEGVAPFGQSAVVRAEGAPGVRIASPDGRARVLLDGWRPGPGGLLALHLVLHAPAATTALIWYQTRAEPGFHPRRRNTWRLERGRNELYLLLSASGIEGPLLFQPGEAPGEYALELCEARSGR